MKGANMIFRLTTGVNGSPFGDQWVVDEGEAKNALDFVNSYIDDALAVLDVIDVAGLIENCWVDAGEGTIPVACMNLKHKLDGFES